MTRGDLIVLLISVLGVASLYGHYWTDNKPGRQALIRVGAETHAVVALAHDQRLSIPGALGVRDIEVKDGSIRFVDSPCRDKVAVAMGWLRFGGEFAVCLPNRVSVQVVSRKPRFDSINF